MQLDHHMLDPSSILLLPTATSHTVNKQTPGGGGTSKATATSSTSTIAMSSMNRFSMPDDAANDAARRKTRKRLLIMGLSAIVLVAIVVSVVASVANRSKSDEKKEPINSASKAVVAACGATLYPDTCVSSLSAAVNTSGPIDPAALFQLSVKVASQALNVSSGILAELGVKQSLSGLYKAALQNCLSFVQVSLSQLEQTLKVTDVTSNKAVEDIKTWLSTALTYQDTCIDGFENATLTLQGLIRGSMKNSTELASNSLAILSAISNFLSHFKLHNRKLLATPGGYPSWVSSNVRKLLYMPGPDDIPNFGQWGGGSWGKGPWNGDGSWSGNGNGPFKGNGPWNGAGAWSGPAPWKNFPGPWQGNGGDGGNAGGSPPSDGSPAPPSDGAQPPEGGIVVAQDGSGHFKTISEAVAAVPLKSTERTIIHVKAGTYAENVWINSTKWNIMMIGEGIDKTVVTGSYNAADGVPTFSTATFGIQGMGFAAKGITFANTAGAAKYQAVALMSASDQSVFYQCKFEAHQDTLYTHSGRQYYRDCIITGTVDFIFGNAAVVFEGCTILPRGPLPGQQDTITAQGRSDPSMNTGISIHNCEILPGDNINGTDVYLGRPWKNYSTTIYMKSKIDGFINPLGWLPWNGTGTPVQDTIYYAEFQNTGAGAATDKRVNWTSLFLDLSAEDVQKYTVKPFIQGDEWLPAVGVTYMENL